MTNLEKARAASKKLRAIEATECPFEAITPPHWRLVNGELVQDAESDPDKATREAVQAKRSEWYEAHWKEVKAAQEALDASVALLLEQRGVHIKADGCGCCDSPHLTVWVDREFVHDGGNWYFGNIPEEWVMPDD